MLLIGNIIAYAVGAILLYLGAVSLFTTQYRELGNLTALVFFFGGAAIIVLGVVFPSGQLKGRRG